MLPAPSTAPETDPRAGVPPTAAGDAQRHHGRGLRGALVLLPLLMLFVTGQRGIDFGHHWDESIQVENLQRAIETQTLLPRWYRYPSVLFWMTLGSLAPELAQELPRDGDQLKAAQKRLTRVAGSGPFRLRLRSVFLAVTCLTIVWTYITAFLWRRSVFEAFLAASLLGLSWEVAYHARWVAPDGVLMQFGAMVTMLLVLAVTRTDGRWLAAGAVAAGLACGTKYTGGILLLPVCVAAWQVWAHDSRAARGARCFGLAALFALAFIASTPGAVLQPFVFFRHVGFEIEHYRTGHYGATVDAGIPHLLAILRYLSAHLFSQQMLLALGVSALALVGTVTALRRSPRRALLLGCMPLVYVLYMSSQRVMFVRNLLLIAPALALFAAHGAARLIEHLRSPERGRSGVRAAQLGAGLLLALIWSVNGTFLVSASQSIRQRDVERDVSSAHEWINAHPDLSVFVSGRVSRKFKELELDLPTNATRKPSDAVEAAVFFPTETPSNAQLIANRPGTCLALFGPLDVNFAYYPAWPNPKVAVYPSEAARQAGVLTGE